MHLLSLASLLLAALAPQSSADWILGLHSPPPQQAVPVQRGLTMPLSEVEVRVIDGVATTTLRQTIHNHERRQAEAEWLLPLPDGAVVDGFEMTVGGVVQASQVLDADQARTVYERIVRQRRDPGLLRYAGRGLLRANVFPIPPQDDVVVRVTYREVLADVSGMTRWTFPATAAGLPGQLPGSLVLDLSITTTGQRLGNVLSPSGGLHVVRLNDFEARASYEGPPPTDELEVLYGVQGERFGLDLLSHLEAGESEGSFLLLVSPQVEWDQLDLPAKRITFVLDTSGSMEGHKLAQARAALGRFLDHLNPEDTFDVVTFSTSADPLFGEPVPASEENVARARRLAAKLDAAGGTNTEAALLAALDRPADGERVPLVVLLTDGRPTIGATVPANLLAKVRTWNAAGSRIFVLGVGNDVNTVLLDQLAKETGASRDYVRPGEDIGAVAGSLFAQLSHPVMTDLELEFDGPRVTRVAPTDVPDLFLGQRLSVVGRYEGSEPVQVRLTGMVGEQRMTFLLEQELAREPDPRFDFVPLMWAERRVAVLLDAMRMDPEGSPDELRDEVVRLGTRYGIVTPYTSHLILEEGMQLAGGGTPSTPGTPASAAPRAPRTGGGGGHGGTYRGPGGTVPPSPASPGAPAPATPGSPAGGYSGGVRTGSSDWYLGADATGGSMDHMVARLRELGVLPVDASDEELRAMAARIGAELRRSAEALYGLGQEDSGARAVDDSAYLAGLLRATESEARRGLSRKDGRTAATKALLDLFRRRVAGKVLHLRAGTWTDAAYDAELHGEPAEVTAFGEAYFALLRQHPELAEVMALSDSLLLVVDGRAVQVVPFEEREEPGEPDEPGAPEEEVTPEARR